MAQSEYLCLERSLRPKQPEEHPPDQVEQVPHRAFIARFGPSRQADGICDSDTCSPTGMHWVYDTYALANGTANAITKLGGTSWFFITADYAFGHSLQRDASAIVECLGGKVVGSVRVPLNSADFSSFLLQAKSSGAKVIGLANAGGDTINAIKQASEFGVTQGGQQLAG